MRIITLNNAGLGDFVKRLVPMAVAGLNVLLLSPMRHHVATMAAMVEDELTHSWGDLPVERINTRFLLRDRGSIKIASTKMDGCCMEHVPIVGVYRWADVPSDAKDPIMVILAAHHDIESLLVLA